MMRMLVRPLGMLVILAAIAMLAWTGARITWRLVGLEAGAAPAPVPLTPPVSAAPPDPSPVIALAPFGAPAPAGALPMIAAPAAPAAPLTDGLVLRGVTVADPQSLSRALIDVRGGPAQRFGIGQEVANGARLAAVDEQGITLAREGETARLGFPRPGDAQAQGAARIRALLSGQPAPAPPPPPRTPDQIIDDYRQRIAVNPMAVLESFDVAPVSGGYRIGASPPPDVARAGLRPGDIIAAVNGVAVGDIEADRRLFETVVASGQARVEIRRGDRRVILSFPLR